MYNIYNLGDQNKTVYSTSKKTPDDKKKIEYHKNRWIIQITQKNYFILERHKIKLQRWESLYEISSRLPRFSSNTFIKKDKKSLTKWKASIQNRVDFDYKHTPFLVPRLNSLLLSSFLIRLKTKHKLTNLPIKLKTLNQSKNLLTQKNLRLKKVKRNT